MKLRKILSSATVTAILTLSLSGCWHHHHDDHQPPPPPPGEHHDGGPDHP